MGLGALEFCDFDKRAGTRMVADAVYGHAPLDGQEVALHATLYLPKQRRRRRPPLLVWIHGGGFRDGTHDQLQIRRLARQLTIEGFALATPEYRLGAGAADLSEGSRARLDELERICVTASTPRVHGGPAAGRGAPPARSPLDWLSRGASEAGSRLRRVFADEGGADDDEEPPPGAGRASRRGGRGARRSNSAPRHRRGPLVQ